MSERLRGSERSTPDRGRAKPERKASKARRQRIFWAVVLLTLVAVGTVLAATSEGSIVRSAGAIVLLGGAAVLVVSLAFLEVGLSEDRERSALRPPGARRRGRSGQRAAIGALLQVVQVSDALPTRGRSAARARPSRGSGAGDGTCAAAGSGATTCSTDTPV